MLIPGCCTVGFTENTTNLFEFPGFPTFRLEHSLLANVGSLPHMKCIIILLVVQHSVSKQIVALIFDCAITSTHGCEFPEWRSSAKCIVFFI